jgi:NAD(P)-dependent dehydrogenase (short-subunit alcohol dehydrogenase family)
MADVLTRFRLDGRTVVVTGASSGLGVGFAKALGSAGARLVLVARREGALEETAAKVRAEAPDCITVVGDVAEPETGSRVVRRALDAFGSVDVLINNAGVGTAVPATRETPDQFRSVINVNLMGSYWMAQACAREMAPGSSIVNIASVLGLIKSYAPQAAYAASKAGVIGLTRDLSAQWAGRKGIRVNAVAPGYFESEMTADIDENLLGPFIAAHSPLARMGRQEELDAAILFLASDASSYITGTTLAVDGGMSGH